MSRPIRLLQLVHGYPPAVGGVELAIRDMCEGLVAEHGFEVTVLTTDTLTISAFADRSLPRIPIDPDEIQNGVRVRRFPVRAGWGPALRQAQRVAYRLRLPGNDWLRTWWNGPISPGMLAAVRELDADVICAAAFPLNHMLYPFRRPEPRPPIVLMPSIHTDDDWGFERPNLLRLVNRSHATVARTEHERDWLVARGADPARVAVIAHGIDPDELQPDPGAFRAKHRIPPDAYLVAYVGQQGAHKGIDVLLRGFPRLLERRPNAWLAIGGSRTPHTAELERLHAALSPQAAARCRLVTDLSPQQKADLLGACDVFASPSRAEAFGITTLEAWALRKPVVVGDSPSQACVVDHGETGVLVPHGDENGLVDALEVLGEEPALRKRLGNAGHARLAERYTRREAERRQAELLTEAAGLRGRTLAATKQMGAAA